VAVRRVRTHRRRRTGLVALAALTALLAPVDHAGGAGAASPTAQPLDFSPSGVEGAGFVNVVVLDPRGNGVALAGGDVSGIHRSADGGRTWVPASDGLSTQSELKVAAFAFSPTEPDTVFAAIGARGADGGLAASTDNGRTWTFRSRVPQFSAGNNDAAGLPTPHPRSTGNLLAADPAGGFLYAATFDDGVMRSADGGLTWTTLGLAGRYLRSLALDPADPDVLYAATYGDGVYGTGSARSTGAFVALAGSPPIVEELFAGGGAVYAAAGSGGVFRSTDSGGSWTRLGTGAPGPVWVSIDGVEQPGGPLLYAGTDEPFDTGTGHVSLMRSDDGGATWSSVTSGTAAIHPDEVGGPGGEPWWLAAVQTENMLGGPRYVASHLAIDHTDPGRVVVAGRSGLWGTADGGRNWYPYVKGLQVTINRQVVADPAVAGRVHVSSSDWVVLASTDGLAHVAGVAPPKGNVGFGITLDTTTNPGRVYAAVGDADANALGDVYSSLDPATAPWASEGLKKPAGGKRPFAVAVGRAPGGGVVIVAAVERSGIWRKNGGSWTKAKGVAMAGRQPTRAASLSWPAGSASVYLYDNGTGVWRSNDRGKTWTRIWARASSAAGSFGQVAADPVDPGRLFVAVPGDGLYRLDGATTGTVGAGITPVRVGPFVAPGPLTFAPDGSLYATENAAATGTPALLRSGDGGATWTDLTAGSALYRAAARLPLGLAVDRDGSVYVALHGVGALVGRPSSTPPE
jgi:hypothetical protein